MNELALPSPSAPLSSRKWTDRFALDLAMTLEGSGDKLPVLLSDHGFSTADLQEFAKDPLFEQRVQVYRTQLRERGLTFKLKAQVQSELLLDTSWDLIHNADVSPAVKADLIKWTSKVAGFEGSNASASDNGVTINIHMGDPSQAPPSGIRTIENV